MRLRPLTFWLLWGGLVLILLISLASVLANFSGTVTAPPIENLQLDPNQATLREWASLPGIGLTLAGRIVAARTQQGGFREKKDLLLIHGLGPKKVEALRPYLIWTVLSPEPDEKNKPLTQ
jgi:competence protein ComEA